jgi:hypothetical protein
LHMHRSRLVRRNARDMHVADLVEVLVSDSTKLPVQEASFDRVLLDAPCSGLGSLRRRPDARWRMEEKEIPVLVDLQKRLVDASVRALRVGGTFVYSVCTLTADETVGIDEYIAENYPELEALSPVRGHGWEPIGRGARIVPAETDGMAVFRYELTTALPPLPVVEARVVAAPAPAQSSDGLVDHNAEVDLDGSVPVDAAAPVDGDDDIDYSDAVVSENEASTESVDSAPIALIAQETPKGQPQPELNRLVSDQAPAHVTSSETSAAKSAPAPQPRRKDPKPVAPSILDLDEL